MGWWWRSDPEAPIKPSNHSALAAACEVADMTSPNVSTLRQQPDLLPTQPDVPNRSPPDSSLYPSTMSCRDAFDAAYYCASFGGKFNDIYRYGELRSCSEHWGQWRFCMRLKVLQPQEREQRVREFYREKEAHTRVGRNSEEVWKRRTDIPERYMWKNPDTMEPIEGLEEKA
ncbi:hypothetical protein EJ05DRAFT_163319 [Pseudovirgaria hyperparasitica]|uniref:Early meiotic induction protein 1 n=1 Tax=Pseudovirgaria hyperparasitica TaxID=470096 RepID=A0A6A6VTN2_9PEZI|nr:uncharacterized protein EJ05DRAFT_163319 [Pseudovirgaria hyperparasitica]KAF2754048.1 hypothetical protein EJ05DRAFT_163319 [Pseudovirgaria hyperparasitica]